MMTDTLITRPAVKHHPEMKHRSSVRDTNATEKIDRASCNKSPGIHTIPQRQVCSIQLILQSPQNTPSRYPYDTPTGCARYPVDTHLIKSQDDVNARNSTGGAKPQKRSAARAAWQSNSRDCGSTAAIKKKKTVSEIFGRCSRFSGQPQ